MILAIELKFLKKYLNIQKCILCNEDFKKFDTYNFLCGYHQIIKDEETIIKNYIKNIYYKLSW